MKLHLLAALALVILSAAPAAAQTPTAKAGDKIGFDYSDSTLANAQVTDFQACFDGAPACFSVTPAASKQTVTPAPPVGTSTYGIAIPTQFVIGTTHSAVLKACNAGGCSSGTAPFTFTWAPTPPATNPSNTRVLPGP